MKKIIISKKKESFVRFENKNKNILYVPLQQQQLFLLRPVLFLPQRRQRLPHPRLLLLHVQLQQRQLRRQLVLLLQVQHLLRLRLDRHRLVDVQQLQRRPRLSLFLRQHWQFHVPAQRLRLLCLLSFGLF